MQIGFYEIRFVTIGMRTNGRPPVYVGYVYYQHTEVPRIDGLCAK
jgi:hypothetical protein